MSPRSGVPCERSETGTNRNAIYRVALRRSAQRTIQNKEPSAREVAVHVSAAIRNKNQVTRWPVSRVLFAHLAIGLAAIPLGRPSRNASRDTPGAQAENGPYAPPIWSCSRRGLPCQRCRHRRGGLLPHPFTLTLVRRQRRSPLCGTFPRLAPGRNYLPPCFHGARTFLQQAVTNLPAAARPSGQAGL